MLFLLILMLPVLAVTVPAHASSYDNSVPTKSIQLAESEWKVFQVSYYGLDFEIPYMVENATLKNIDLDIANDRVTAMLQSDPEGNQGRITLQISKNLIWSDFLNNHQYEVFIDGVQATGNYAPQYLAEASCFEKVSIRFPANAQKIEITSLYAPPTLRHLASGGFIATDKACYRQGDVITVFGQASPSIEPFLITTPHGTQYSPITNFTSNEDGSFTARFVIQGANATIGLYGLMGDFPRVWNGSYVEKPDVRFMLLTRDYENLTIGKSVLARQQGDEEYSPVSWANTTDFYLINTEIVNDSDEPKAFEYITMVLDNDGITQQISNGQVEALPKQNTSAGVGYFYWMPEKAGDYTIKTFVWTDLENPKPVLESPNTINVTVKDKISKLSVGERDAGLQVMRIDLAAQAVTVSYVVCAPASAENEKVLHIGESADISSYAVAYFLGFDDGKAIFKYESTGRGLCSLV